MKRGVVFLLGLLLIGGVVWTLLPGDDSAGDQAAGARGRAPAGERFAVDADASAAADPRASVPPAEAEAPADEPAAVESTVADSAPEEAAALTQLAGGWRGVVRDPAGQPLAGVAVDLLAINEEIFGGGDQFRAQLNMMRNYMTDSGQWDQLFSSVESRRTDAQGRFRFSIPEGEGPWQLRLVHPGFVAARTSDFETAKYPASEASFGLVPGASLEVQALTPSGEPVAAQLGIEPSGESDEALGSGVPFPLHQDRVAILQALNPDMPANPFGTKNAVLIAESSATSEEVVVVEDEGEAVAPPSEPAAPEAAAADTGPRTVQGLAPGAYTVTASASGYARGSAEVTVTAGAKQRVRVQLQQGLTLSGRVIDGRGQPIEGATVTGIAYTADMNMFTPMGYGQQVSATSAADGTFTLVGLEDAQHFLNAAAEGYVETGQGAAMTGMPKTYRPGQGEPVELVLQATVSIAGRVVGGPGEQSGVSVVATRVGSWSPNHSALDGSGGFVIAGVTPGRYSLTAVGGEWITLEPVEVRVGPDGLSGVELQLERGPRVEVRVRLTGRPLEGAQLQLTGGDAGRGFSPVGASTASVTDASGQGILSGITPGEYTLQVSHDACASATVPVAVSTGTQAVEVELEAGAVLQGKLLDADGTPAMAQLFLVREGESLVGGTSLDGSTDGEGAFEITGLTAGSYVVHAVDVTSGGMSPKLKRLGTVQFAAGETLQREFRFEAPELTGTLEGQLLQGGEPLVMRQVQARSLSGGDVFDGGMLWFSTDAEGRFKHDEVRPGSYRVWGAGTEEVVVEVRAQQVARVVLEVKAGVVAGRVLDQLGQPLAGATVLLRPAAGRDPMDAFGWGKGGVTTDSTGAFSVPDLAAGTYVIAASGVGIGSSTPQEVTLTEDQSKTGLELRLEPTPEVTVRVLGSDGQPLPGAQVSYYAAALRAQSFELEFGSQRTTNRAGTTLFEELTPGDYVFAANSPVSGAAVSQRLSLGPGDELSVTLRLEAPGKLRVSGPPRASLQVTLVQSQAPPPNVPGVLWANTDDSGSCLISDLPAAEYRVEASVEGRTLSWSGQVSPGAEAQASLR